MKVSLTFLSALVATVSAHQNCEDMEDNTERFYVPDTMDPGMRKCDWATRIMKDARCKIPEVRQNCPRSCDVPCRTPPADSVPLPKCDELSDDTSRFKVPSTTNNYSMRLCAWAARRPDLKAQRCALEEVSEHCPVTCGKPCEPTLSSPSTSCPNLADATGRFYVPDTSNPGMRKCNWVTRIAHKKEARCNIPEVRQYCPIACGVPCYAPPADPTPLEHCHDLADATGRFYVPDTLDPGMRKCDWATRIAHKKESRCNIPEVSQKCPVSCGVPCVPDPPTKTPTASPTIARLADEEVSCYDLHDNTERFYVEGSAHPGMRKCSWADRISYKKEKRCQIPEVRENCPVTCGVPCTEPSVLPNCDSLSDVDDDHTFFVSNIEEPGYNTCSWITSNGEEARKQRCATAVVMFHCPVSCKVDCTP